MYFLQQMIFKYNCQSRHSAVFCSINKLMNMRQLSENSSVPPCVIVKEENGVRRIIMNDHITRNSLSLNLMQQLISAINKSKDDSDLRCIVLSSSHNQVFSSGHNLKHMDVTSEGKDKVKIIFDTCSELMLSIIKHPVPVIAVVNGIAAAAGCQLVSTCDVTLCTNKSKFSTPGAHHGIFCSTPSVALVRKIPVGLALSITITGIPINADTAFSVGLVSKVAESEEELDKETNKVIESILGNSRSVLSLGKTFFYEQLSMPLEQAYRAGSETMVKNLCLKDGIEGMQAFKEKRKPIWTHNNEMGVKGL